ncbi:MAG: 23S rRNA (pseudouridine(1915)-N(3))-methyltransferase RlmH [Alphaproteobacteria bacterium]|nr:23S rRNA (pseudouridine(1915)-N(3))-methyltransferase RlmH [Alphaproteobacteria bacterium]
MKINIVAIGKCKKNSPEYAIIEEYIKRSNWQINIKEKDNSNQVDEAEFLNNSIKSGKVVVLDERGQNMKSTELATIVENWQLNGTSEINFLIGGADGHLQSTRDKADLILSFGKLTMPHMLMRAVLAEQIYRIQTIITKHPYHRE